MKSMWTHKVGNFFVFCLLGSLFIQPSPGVVITALSLFMLLTLAATTSGRTWFKAVFSKESYLITWAFLIWFLGHCVIALVHPPWTWRHLGNHARALTALAVLAYLINAKPSAKWLYAGFAIACLAAFAHSINDNFLNQKMRSIGWFNNEIHFGSYSGLAGLFSILVGYMAVDLQKKWRVALICTGFMGFAAAVFSGSRSAMLIFICLLPFLWIKHIDSFQGLLRFALYLFLPISILLVLLVPGIQHQTRLSSAVSDIQGIQEGKGQTSTADRLQMWRGAINMARSSPLIGVGMSNFQAQLQHQLDTGEIKPLAEIRNQAHSQSLHSLATGGLLLLCTYLLFLALPLIWFGKLYKIYAADFKMRLLSYLGLTNIISHIIFGLFNAIFDIQIFSSVYPLCLATLAALCIIRKAQLQTDI